MLRQFGFWSILWRKTYAFEDNVGKINDGLGKETEYQKKIVVF
jgi:hypothetical protein